MARWGTWARSSVRCGLALAALIGLLPLVAADGLTPRPALAADDGFAFNWEGRPAAPQPWTPLGWDAVVHSRDQRTWQSMDPVPAQHGADCGAPPATHVVTSYQDALFVCNNHLMTAFLPGGYGEIELAPDRMVDWSGGTATVGWHQSTFRTSARDWTDINVTPLDDNLVLPATTGVDLSGEPRNGIQVAMSTAIPTTFSGQVFRNFAATPLAGSSARLEQALTPSAVQRAHFQLDISRTHVRFGLPDQGIWFIDQEVAELPFTRGVVQLGHHSYTPDKECTPQPGVLSCTGDTWHWSDFSMAPARKFTMLPGDMGSHLSHDTPSTVNFASAAPADSHLRFAAAGGMSVSFDGGRTFEPARVQPGTRNQSGSFRGDVFNSYWTPVPAGTSSVTFSGQDTFYSWWWVKDVSIWSPADPAQLRPAATRPAPQAAATTRPLPAASARPPARSPLTARLRRAYAAVTGTRGGLLVAGLMGAAALLLVLLVHHLRRKKGNTAPS